MSVRVCLQKQLEEFKPPADVKHFWSFTVKRLTGEKVLTPEIHVSSGHTETPETVAAEATWPSDDSRSLSRSTSVQQTGGNSASVGDCLQRRINPHLALQRGRCVCLPCDDVTAVWLIHDIFCYQLVVVIQTRYSDLSVWLFPGFRNEFCFTVDLEVTDGGQTEELVIHSKMNRCPEEAFNHQTCSEGGGWITSPPLTDRKRSRVKGHNTLSMTESEGPSQVQSSTPASIISTCLSLRTVSHPVSRNTSSRLLHIIAKQAFYIQFSH